ncbi:MAG: hypothetical protein K2J04_15115, partial [Lachnospiraceae bacterium]|nr:hypothetical protein [Lachnospiraceae bacterium]
MLLLKANPELHKVFGRLIKAMKVPVTWTDTFIIMNNSLVLAGDVRSLVFNFDNKKVSTTIIEVPVKSAQLESMPNDTLLNNVMNMILYAFGKWGAISVKVDKDYTTLNSLFENILRPVNIEPGFTAENFHFFKDGMQVTYEDTMLAILRLLKDEGKLKEGQSLATSEENTQDDAPTKNAASQNNMDDAEADYDYQIGLWHNLCWKKASYEFRKSLQTETDTTKSRIGRDFYITNYMCPNCSQKLYVGVYPTDKELLIDTEEGRVFMARTYACHECNTFYTPRPGKLLQEGDVYHLQFDEDRTAYEDYLDILGDKAERTTNYKFNEFASERSLKKRTDTEADWKTEEMSAEEPVSFSPASAFKGIKEMLSKYAQSQTAEEPDADAGQKPDTPHPQRANAQGKSAEVQSMPHSGAHNTSQNDVHVSAAPGNTEKVPGKTEKQAIATPASGGHDSVNQRRGSEPTPDTSYLTEKSTDELKSILEHLERSDKASLSEFGVNAPNSEYIETVTGILHEKLTAKYDARMGVLNKLSFKQLTDLRKQIVKETVFSNEEKDNYKKKIDHLLYEAEAAALKQKVEQCKKMSYAEIEQTIAYVESRDVPDEL